MHRRAPCIWTVHQRVDPNGMFRVFAGAPPRDDGLNRWFLFRRRVDLPAAPVEARLDVTADGKYQLFVNGRRLGRGPMRCSPTHQRYDTHDIQADLRAGENVIAVLVHVYGTDTAWYERVRGLWRENFGDGALWCEGFARCGSAVLPIDTDLDWRCLESDAWEREVPRVNLGLGFVEVLDARRLPVGWTEPGFDDSGWDGVQILRTGGGGPEADFGGMTIEPFTTLVLREIPFLEEVPTAPERVVWWSGLVSDPALPVEDRIYREELAELPAHALENPDALLHPGRSATVVRTPPGLDVTCLLDFGRIHSGHPFLEIEARGGEIVELAASERLPGEWRPGGPDPRARVARHPSALGLDAHVCRYIARPGVQRFERFEWTAVRWLQVAVRNAPEGLRIRHVGSLFTRYPVEERGEFACSDALLTRLWEIGRYTLRLCMHDGFEDCPSREQRQWLGDATVEHLVAEAAFGPSCHALNRQFLRQCAESQRPDGLTQMFAPGDHRRDGLLIPDWTLQWILNAEHYLLYSGDVEVIEEIFPAIQRALAWFERQLGPNGLVAHCPYWHFMDWAGLGREGEAAALNAQTIGALRAAARLARALEWERGAKRWEALAESMAAVLAERHWDARRGVYVDVVDPATGEQDPRVSQHANAGLILWDVAPRERWPGMIGWITDAKRLKFTKAPGIVPTGETLVPETDCVLANTFYSHFVQAALAKAGRFDAALALIRDRYGRMLARGATTLWESFEPTGSLCHGFSATPTWQLSTCVLGVAPLAPGFARFSFSPQPADLAFARGVFPTVKGDVRVAWERGEDGVAIELHVPEGAVAVPVDPPGHRFADAPRELAPGRHRLRLVRDRGLADPARPIRG